MDQENLRTCRVALRCSQYKVAQLAGLSRNRLSLIECYYVEAKPEELKKIEYVLKKIEKEVFKNSFVKWGAVK